MSLALFPTMQQAWVLEKMLPLLSSLPPHPVHSFLLLKPGTTLSMDMFTDRKQASLPHTDTTTTPGAQNGEVERI